MNSPQAHAVEKSGPQFRILGSVSLSHFLNDMLQSLIIAIYPLLKGNYHLSFAQIGLITLTYQCSASLLQPWVGYYTDRHPQPRSLVLGMSLTLGGLLTLANAHSFALILAGSAIIGTGSSIFHPESSRVARMASGGRYGMAQSIFQVGGNAGTAVGPLLAALIVWPLGQRSLFLFALPALVAMAVLWTVGNWYAHQHRQGRVVVKKVATLAPRQIALAFTLLILLMVPKYFYLASLTSFFTFYLIEHFHLGVQAAQFHLFLFLAAVAAGTVLGGPIGDRVGRKRVIVASILGITPFSLAMPYANLFWTGGLSVVIGFVLASAFSAILVYAQELLPGKVGLVSGTFFGLAFGLGGVGAAVLGQVADREGIEYVYQLCAWLPLAGLFAIRLPEAKKMPPGCCRRSA